MQDTVALWMVFFLTKCLICFFFFFFIEERYLRQDAELIFIAI